MTRTRRFLELIARFTSDSKALGAFSVLLAGLILVEVNLLSVSAYRRFDFSEDMRFTLSPQTVELLERFESEVRVTVLLPISDPLAIDVRHTLDAYRASSQNITVTFVDPDRNTTEYLALAAEHPLMSEQDSTGQAQPAVALIVAVGKSYQYVRRRDLSESLPDGTTQQSIESALSEAMVGLFTQKKKTVCFTTGNGELSPEDVGPEGLSELDRQLVRLNLTPERIDLKGGRENPTCDLFVVCGPKMPISPEAESRLLRSMSEGADFLLLLDPIVDAKGDLLASSLQKLTQEFGIRQLGGFVLEGAAERRLPQGIGEVFLAEPSPHRITSTLQTDAFRSQVQFVASATQAFELFGPALPLLTASPTAELLRDLSQAGGVADRHHPGPLVVAAVGQRETGSTFSKLALFGFSSFAENEALLDPNLTGNRQVLLASLAWLAESPATLGISPPRARATSLPLTEASLSELLRYVLLYMPGASALLGLFIYLRRRRNESRSRSKPRYPGERKLSA